MGLFSAFTRLTFGAAKPIAQHVAGEEVIKLASTAAGKVVAHFSDPSKKLSAAIQRSQERAWSALEIALGGESLWAWFDAKETKAVRELIGDFLLSVQFGDLSAFPPDFRTRCAKEVRAIRKSGLLAATSLDKDFHEKLAADLARYGDPAGMVTAEQESLAAIGEQLKKEGYEHLPKLLAQPAGLAGRKRVRTGPTRETRRVLPRRPAYSNRTVDSGRQTLGFPRLWQPHQSRLRR